MADVHNYNPTALQLALVARGEAVAKLEGPIDTPARCIAAAFATSGKDRPLRLDDTRLVVLLAEAVIRQAEEIEKLREAVAGVKKHANNLDGRTLGLLPMGPAASNHREAESAAKRKAALEELKARMEANPEWVASRDKLNADLAVRRAAREGTTTPEPPLPTGGLGE